MYSRNMKRCHLHAPIWVPRIENQVPESEKIIIESLESEKIRSLESEKSGPHWVPNIFLKKCLIRLN